MNKELMGMHVVLVGNPVDGVEVFGPFKTGDDAVEWASAYCRDDRDWWVARLLPKEAGE